FREADGIRGVHVSGVQTCALPITEEGEHDVRTACHAPVAKGLPKILLVLLETQRCGDVEYTEQADRTVDQHAADVGQRIAELERSEERRVGSGRTTAAITQCAPVK